MADIFALSVPIQVTGEKEATAALMSVGRVGQQVAKDISMSFSTSKSGLILPTTTIVAATNRTREFSAAAKAASTDSMRYARAAFQVSGVMQAIAATGRTTNQQIQKLIGTASGVAFAFGPTGAVVGAIGLTVLAIADMFKKTADGMEELKEKAIKDVREIFRETSLAAAKARQEGLASERFDLEDQLRGLTEKRAARIAAEARLFRPGTPEERIVANIMGQEKFSGGEFTDITKKIAVLTEALKGLGDRAGASAIVVNKLAGAEAALAKQRSLNAFGAREMLIGGIAGIAARAGIGGGRADEERVEAALARTTGPKAGDLGKGAEGMAARARARIDAELARLKVVGDEAIQLSQEIGATIAATLGGGIAEGFRIALSGGGILAGIEALGRSVLSALGGFLQSLGTKLLLANELFQKAMAFFGGPLGIAASLGLIALGGALQGIAGAGGGGAGGGRAGGGGIGGGGGGLSNTMPTQSSAYTFNAQGSDFTKVSQPSVKAFHITILGTPTTKNLHELGTWIDKAERMGYVGNRRG